MLGLMITKASVTKEAQPLLYGHEMQQQTAGVAQEGRRLGISKPGDGLDVLRDIDGLAVGL